MKNFKNETKLNRTAHDENNFYTRVSNQLIQDERLTIIEVGIMVKLLSNSDDYIFNSNYFKTTLGIGSDLYNKSMHRLVELGYINKIRIQGGIHWIINEISNSIRTENTPSENTPCGNTPLIIINETKKTSNSITGPDTGTSGKFEDVENLIKKESTEKLTETKIPVAIRTEKEIKESSTPTAGSIFKSSTRKEQIVARMIEKTNDDKVLAVMLIESNNNIIKKYGNELFNELFPMVQEYMSA